MAEAQARRPKGVGVSVIVRPEEKAGNHMVASRSHSGKVI
jgi:hypothetical protein